MRAPLTLLLMLILIRPLFAQSAPSEPPDTVRPVTVRHTQVHLGFRTQVLWFGGIRQFIGDRVFSEISLGGTPRIPGTHAARFSHTVGVSFIPEATKYEQGFCYSVLYSFASDTFFGANRKYQHILTANAGYLYQHETGVSFLGRGGIGLTRKTLEEQYGVFPWVNLEFSLGYAF